MTKPETEKLLPCPHCGGAPTVHTEGWDAAQFIRCTECSANTRLFKTREEAVAAWNRRTAPAAIGYIGPGELAWLKDGACHATIYPNMAPGFVPIYTDPPTIRAQGGGEFPACAYRWDGRQWIDPNGNPATPDAAPDALEILADALDCFWNAALGATRQHEDATANAVMSGMVEGIAAVAVRIRESKLIAHARSAGGEGRE
jgi:Lar family restriction alleviation protein